MDTLCLQIDITLPRVQRGHTVSTYRCITLSLVQCGHPVSTYRHYYTWSAMVNTPLHAVFNLRQIATKLIKFVIFALDLY